MKPGSPNPLDEPWLSFPFTARQLAALMIDGWGHLVRDWYGDWKFGPDDAVLAASDGKVVEALRGAYQAYRQAEELAPRLDLELETAATALAARYEAARKAAMDREQLRDHRHPDAEYAIRLARVNDAVAELDHDLKVARDAADIARAGWRRAMVQHLLLPIEQVSAECFESQTLRAVAPDRRAAALYQAHRQDLEDAAAHWDLVCEQQRVEAELRRWRSLTPQTVTEAALHDTKLGELAAKLASISSLTQPMTPLANLELTDGANAPLNPALLATRDELYAAFGSFGLKKTWFNELNSHHWLLMARKVGGLGQRSWRREPLFCPYEVMTGLVEKSRKGRISIDTGWRVLEHKFPDSYAAFSAGDPREPSG
jgi:hypothetical protein